MLKLNAELQCKECKKVLLVDTGEWVKSGGYFLTGLYLIICPECNKKIKE